MDFIEVSAKTVDEAITKACIEIGVSSDRLDVQVVSEGSSGFLGFGSKPAVIKARKKEEPEEKEEASPIEAAKEIEEEKTQEKTTEKEINKEIEKTAGKTWGKKVDSGRYEDRKEGKRDFKKDLKRDLHRDSRQDFKKEIPPVREVKEVVIQERTEEEIAVMKAAASKFLEGVFRAMDLPVNTSMEYQKEEGCLNIDFEGDDMGILIGKRGQTLDSLQYLTSLVVNKEVDGYVRVKLDTEDYRKRRKDTLENLAKNIAFKVKRSRKPVSLEPMNPYERRIIHSALQANRYVETHSEGSEPYRHVVVTYKR